MLENARDSEIQISEAHKLLKKEPTLSSQNDTQETTTNMMHGV